MDSTIACEHCGKHVAQKRKVAHERACPAARAVTATRRAEWPASLFADAGAGPAELVTCSLCGRRFASERFAVHWRCCAQALSFRAKVEALDRSPTAAEPEAEREAEEAEVEVAEAEEMELETCPHCERSYSSARLPMHLSICARRLPGFRAAVRPPPSGSTTTTYHMPMSTLIVHMYRLLCTHESREATHMRARAVRLVDAPSPLLLPHRGQVGAMEANEREAALRSKLAAAEAAAQACQTQP